MLGALSASASISWTPWAVGNTGSTVVNGDGSVTFKAGDDGPALWSTGQTRSKAFYSTDAFNGQTVGSLLEMSYTLVATTPADAGDGLSGPYLNIAVKNGTGGHAILLLDAMPSPLGQQKHVFSTAQFNFNEQDANMAAYITSLGAPDSIHDGKNWYDYSDVAGLIIAGGFAESAAVLPAVAPTSGWASWSATGSDDGVILAVGNRGSTPITEATINGLTVVPEPTTMIAGALLLLPIALGGLRKVRKQA
jgi:hypothetical protein